MLFQIQILFYFLQDWGFWKNLDEWISNKKYSYFQMNITQNIAQKCKFIERYGQSDAIVADGIIIKIY